jgi:methylaspartate ammonia-lyase
MVEQVLGNARYTITLAAYPHGLFNSQEKLRQLAGWLAYWTKREKDICGSLYPPPYLHCDTYGQIGELVNQGAVTSWDHALIEKTADWILEAGTHTEKNIRIEGAIEIKPEPGNLHPPLVLRLRDQQVKANAQLLLSLYSKGFTGQLVSDEYVNSPDDITAFIDEIKYRCHEKGCDIHSVLQHYMIQIKPPVFGDISSIIDAALYCASEGVHVYIGGTCNETAISAHHVYTVAAVLKPLLAQVLLRPGMDVRMGLLTYADWQNNFLQDFVLKPAPGYGAGGNTTQ